MVADRDEGPPHTAPDEIQGAHEGQHDEHEQEEVHLPLGRDPEPEELRAWDFDGRLHPAADEGDVVDGPFDDELPGQRGDGEVEPLDPERREADDGADRRRHEAAHGQRGPERPAEPHREVGRRVGAHRHERAVAHRDLAAVPHEDVEAEGADDGDRGEIDDGQVVLVERERHHREHEQRDDAHRPARDRQRIERHVRRVRRLQHPALTMNHARLQRPATQGPRGVSQVVREDRRRPRTKSGTVSRRRIIRAR